MAFGAVQAARSRSDDRRASTQVRKALASFNQAQAFWDVQGGALSGLMCTFGAGRWAPRAANSVLPCPPSKCRQVSPSSCVVALLFQIYTKTINCAYFNLECKSIDDVLINSC